MNPHNSYNCRNSKNHTTLRDQFLRFNNNLLTTKRNIPKENVIYF